MSRGLREKITSRTKSILPVHIAGYPCDMESITDICRKYNSISVDNAIITRYRGQMIGNLGDLFQLLRY
ncbi:TPA: hypothetical protein EYN98_31025 [Candidatus Poribacteria bacterium]|nr:hypothetical protein [Candidatus Poribacteria bacterium]HIB88377.1 hypothetical protein [Candidatus Poribacteria bacterium]HIC02953.1 hypothetical protein [Candidatus Poribacteria bacterium]HIC18609.1 hypothetical protein [Candidatus Poribacteria bacterium]HIM09616.1 hypothetical protein [Candidatus Poribacteria bacterium]